MKEKSFKVYIVRLLKVVQPGIRLTSSAAEAMDSILRVIADRLVDRSLVLTTGDDKKTISEREIQTAVQLVFPEAFARDSIQFSNNILSVYEKSEVERQAQPVEKAQTRESRCGLIFSVSAAEKYVRRFGQVGLHVSYGTPIVLAAILEYFTTQLLRETGDVTKSAKKITISVRHLFLASNKDSNLAFVHNLGVVFLEGGVEPQAIQNKQHKRLQRSKSESTEPKGHRWRPGTKTVMEIRRLQKSGDMLMQHAPFNNLVRELVARYDSEEKERDKTVRLTGDFCTTLQAFIEDRMIQLMRRANRMAVHANRETVYARDVELVCEMTGENYPATTCETNIPEAALRQMALRAGIQRFGDCSTEAYRSYMIGLLNSYLYDIFLCARHHKVQTLNTKVFLEAMGMRGVHPSIVAHKRKTVKKGLSRQNSKTTDTESTVDDEEELANPELSDVEEETAV